MILVTPTPNFVGRVRSVGGKIFQGGIRKLCGFFNRCSAQHFAGELRMGGDIARSLARFDREGRSLDQLWLETPGGFAQRLECLLADASRVRAGESNPTPEI